VRLEKRTKVTGAVPKTPTDEVVPDALSALRVLRAQAGVDRHRMSVLGHSLGATMALVVAQQDAEVTGIVALALSARPLEDSLLEQLQYLSAHSPSDASLQRLVEDAVIFRHAANCPVRPPDLS
jgi:uncharacterized protein